jgi:Tim10/DDP family zinc finger
MSYSLFQCSTTSTCSNHAVADNRIQATCFAKCINKRYYEGELTTGEGVCLDRCVSKYFATHDKMNEVPSKCNHPR